MNIEEVNARVKKVISEVLEKKMSEIGDDVNFVKVWDSSRDWFDQARAIGTFTQWISDNAYDYVKRIEIPIRQ